MFPKIVVPPNHPWINRVFHYNLITIHFGVFPLFSETPISMYIYIYKYTPLFFFDFHIYPSKTTSTDHQPASMGSLRAPPMKSPKITDFSPGEKNCGKRPIPETVGSCWKMEISTKWDDGLCFSGGSCCCIPCTFFLLGTCKFLEGVWKYDIIS